MSDKILQVTDSSFDTDVSSSDVPVLVDFWAEWCGPCKMIAPILDQIAEEYDGKIRVAKVNIDESKQIAAKYAIRSIPTLMLFKDGNVVDTKIGGATKSQLSVFIDSAI
jgi:thioredoxin 1